MNLTFDDTESALAESCRRILVEHAGPSRARELMLKDELDHDLARILGSGGYLDLAKEDYAGPVTASLVTEWCAESAVVFPVGTRAMVAPHVFEDPEGIPAVIAIMTGAPHGLVRYGVEADALIVVDGQGVELFRHGAWEAERVTSRYGYPASRVLKRGRPYRVMPGSDGLIHLWWLLSISAEIVGTAQAALDVTVRYMAQRAQFGRPLASFQALRHRVVHCAAKLEGARWLGREAAACGPSGARAGSAAIAAYEAAAAVMVETHQMTGAIGFTQEHDLHLWTMRLQWLRAEAGGIRAYADILADARWPAK